MRKKQLCATVFTVTALFTGILTMTTPKAHTTEHWIQDETGWRYQCSNGSFLSNEDCLIGNHCYTFNEDGYLVSGWTEHDGHLYYTNPDGTVGHGWIQKEDTNEWYYFDENGCAMRNTTVDGYVLDSNGVWKESTHHSTSHHRNSYSCGSRRHH